MVSTTADGTAMVGLVVGEGGGALPPILQAVNRDDNTKVAKHSRK